MATRVTASVGGGLPTAGGSSTIPALTLSRSV
jgi:hypothetical protein